MKAEEIKSLASLLQVHDAGLSRLRLKPQPGQQHGQPLQCGLRLLPGSAHHHQVIAVTDQHAEPARIPHPVQPVQVDVAEQR